MKTRSVLYLKKDRFYFKTEIKMSPILMSHDIWYTNTIRYFINLQIVNISSYIYLYVRRVYTTAINFPCIINLNSLFIRGQPVISFEGTVVNLTLHLYYM